MDKVIEVDAETIVEQVCLETEVELRCRLPLYLVITDVCQLHADGIAVVAHCIERSASSIVVDVIIATHVETGVDAEIIDGICLGEPCLIAHHPSELKAWEHSPAYSEDIKSAVGILTETAICLCEEGESGKVSVLIIVIYVAVPLHVLPHIVSTIDTREGTVDIEGELWVLVILGCLILGAGGALVQRVTGFGMGIFAMLFSYGLGLPLGLLMARRKDKLADKLGMVYIIFIIAVPSLAYIYLFRYLMTSAFDLPSVFTTYGPGDGRSWILPIISLALPSIASLMLWTRRYVVDQMNSDYVKFAKAKGLNQGEIFRGHIFKNAIIPIAHGIPASLAGCITGAIITEAIYSVGGMGKMLPNAINQYNNVMIIALAFMFSTVSVLSVLAGDILITKVDPRISLSEKAGRS